MSAISECDSSVVSEGKTVEPCGCRLYEAVEVDADGEDRNTSDARCVHDNVGLSVAAALNGGRSPRAARSAAAEKYRARSRGASGTPLNPGMHHMSTTYGFPPCSMMSTP